MSTYREILAGYVKGLAIGALVMLPIVAIVELILSCSEYQPPAPAPEMVTDKELSNCYRQAQATIDICTIHRTNYDIVVDPVGLVLRCPAPYKGQGCDVLEGRHQ